MTVMLHPVPWRRPVHPDDLVSGTVQVIRGGAQTVGSSGDAYVVHSTDEQARRQAIGLGAVTPLSLLDAVMNLPLETPVRADDLGAETAGRLSQAPPGVLTVDGSWIIRLLTPPLTVVACAVDGPGWRRLMRRAAGFGPFAQQVMILRAGSTARPSVVWEAQVAGIGVWTRSEGQFEEHLPPQAFVRRYWKAAGWRFAEQAYGTLLMTSFRPPEPSAVPDRRSCRGI
jgi:hypothetical protein